MLIKCLKEECEVKALSLNFHKPLVLRVFVTKNSLVLEVKHLVEVAIYLVVE